MVEIRYRARNGSHSFEFIRQIGKFTLKKIWRKMYPVIPYPSNIKAFVMSENAFYEEVDYHRKAFGDNSKEEYGIFVDTNDVCAAIIPTDNGSVILIKHGQAILPALRHELKHIQNNLIKEELEAKK